ncbi:MAG: Lpg1974 family pore-forming outer membrane protein [Chlamydiota bacterium]
MNLGLLALHIMLGSVLPESSLDTVRETLSSQNKANALVLQSIENVEALNKELEFVQAMLKKLEQQNLELKNDGEKNTEAVKLEVLAINESFLKERAQYLHQIAVLEQNLEKMNLKVDRLHEKAMKKFSNQVGELIATATLPDNYVESSPEQPSLSIFKYRPEIKKSAGYVGIEFLWWKVYEGALDYAVKGQKGANPGSSQQIGSIGKMHYATFTWAPGYRVYVGYRFAPDFWEVEANYTYYHSSHSNQTYHPKGYPPNIVETIPPSGNPLPAKTTVGTFTQYTHTPVRVARASVSINYNLGDILLARRLLATDALLLRVLLGVTGGSIDQHMSYKYLPGSVIINGIDFGTGSTVKGRENWKFSGAGLRLGLDTDWFMGKGFSLLSEGSFALIFGPWSKFAFNKTNNHLPSNEITTLTPQVTNDIHINDHRFIFHLRLALMPAWGKQYNRFGFLLYAGYELNFFANLQEVYRPVFLDDSPTGGRDANFTAGFLGIQGLTAGLKFDF